MQPTSYAPSASRSSPATATEVLSPQSPQQASGPVCFVPVVHVTALGALRSEYEQKLAEMSNYHSQDIQELSQKVDFVSTTAFSRIGCLERRHQESRQIIKRLTRENQDLKRENQGFKDRLIEVERYLKRLEYRERP